MEKMIFETDRQAVEEGGIVEVQWDCHEADRVELTIDNGFKQTVIPLELQGSKRFRLHRSKGRTRLTVTAYVGEKHYSKTIKVRVTDIPTVQAEEVDRNGNPIGALGRWWNRTAPQLRTAWARARSTYRTWPRWGRTLFWVAVAVCVLSLFPGIGRVLMGLLAMAALVLLVVLLRRRR